MKRNKNKIETIARDCTVKERDPTGLLSPYSPLIQVTECYYHDGERAARRIASCHLKLLPICLLPTYISVQVAW
jgi:hypothetical protein